MEAVVGVVIGWFLSSVGQAAGWYWRHREQTRMEREVARSKARLLLGALDDAEFQLRRISSGETVWKEVGFATGSLKDQLQEMVGSFTTAEWNAALDATRELQAINAMTAHRSEPDDERLQRGVALAAVKLVDARRALERLAN